MTRPGPRPTRPPPLQLQDRECCKRTPVKLIRVRFICKKRSLGGRKQKERKKKTQVDFSRGVRSQPSNYAVYAPGVGVLPKKSNRIFCSAHRIFCSANRVFFFAAFGSIDRETRVVLATRRIVMSKDYRELNLCLLLDHRERQQRGSLTKRPFQRFCPPNHKRKSTESNASNDGLMVVHPADISDNSLLGRGVAVQNRWAGEWRSKIAFLYLFHFRSLLCLTFLLSPNKQNEKLNFDLPIETQSRMLARLSRSTRSWSRQHPGQSLSFCSVIDLEAHFDKTWTRSSVNKLNY